MQEKTNFSLYIKEDEKQHEGITYNMENMITYKARKGRKKIKYIPDMSKNRSLTFKPYEVVLIP